jgi:hypothetical protein
VVADRWENRLEFKCFVQKSSILAQRKFGWRAVEVVLLS